MERTKKQFIQELITSAQDSIWKNELAYLYNEQFAENGADKDVKRKATLNAIEKDKQYIEFLNIELQK